MRRFAFAATIALVSALMPSAARAENPGSDQGIQVNSLVYHTNVSQDRMERTAYQEVRWGGWGAGYGWGGPRVGVYVGRPYYGGYYSGYVPYRSYYYGAYPYYGGYGSYYPYYSGYPYYGAYGGYTSSYWPSWY